MYQWGEGAHLGIIFVSHTCSHKVTQGKVEEWENVLLMLPLPLIGFIFIASLQVDNAGY